GGRTDKSHAWSRWRFGSRRLIGNDHHLRGCAVIIVRLRVGGCVRVGVIGRIRIAPEERIPVIQPPRVWPTVAPVRVRISKSVVAVPIAIAPVTVATVVTITAAVAIAVAESAEIPAARKAAAAGEAAASGKTARASGKSSATGETGAAMRHSASAVEPASATSSTPLRESKGRNRDAQNQ